MWEALFPPPAASQCLDLLLPPPGSRLSLLLASHVGSQALSGHSGPTGLRARQRRGEEGAALGSCELTSCQSSAFQSQAGLSQRSPGGLRFWGSSLPGVPSPRTLSPPTPPCISPGGREDHPFSLKFLSDILWEESETLLFSQRKRQKGQLYSIFLAGWPVPRGSPPAGSKEALYVK